MTYRNTIEQCLKPLPDYQVKCFESSLFAMLLVLTYLVDFHWLKCISTSSNITISVINMTKTLVN